jgi:hypothetical protein
LSNILISNQTLGAGSAMAGKPRLGKELVEIVKNPPPYCSANKVDWKRHKKMASKNYRFRRYSF